MVKGKVQYQEATKTQYDVMEVLSGLPVVFQNSQFKNFVFYTNERGEYSAYLPVGHYKVFVDGNALQKMSMLKPVKVWILQKEIPRC